ncbi:transcription antitermination factor NusB [Flavicella sediminum]|uniref:transcription antitermination factor NusB n=1 Tax=Flavicella sediminum TaxID=2585141 RepID=UPI00111E36D6|nr:transcription antitermination factor NusB [Flavicella sediminum]
MINRRHIRVKVMQSVYAMLTSNSDNLKKEENFLRNSIDKMYDLYVLMLDVLPRVQAIAQEKIEISKNKHFVTEADLNPNTKFVENKVFDLISGSVSFQTYKEEHYLDNWHIEESYMRTIFERLEKSQLYAEYMKDPETSFKKDVKFMVKFFSEFIAPNETLAAYYEDINISWVDDIPFVNTWVVRTLESLKKNKSLVLNRMYKDDDDKQFVVDLFRKVVLNHTKFEKEIEDKTPNWETDRIADLDMILIKMGICEFMHFPSIPTKATINEYIEVAKDYSTQKSSFFINGVLDKICKDLEKSDRLNKVGRGRL